METIKTGYRVTLWRSLGTDKNPIQSLLGPFDFFLDVPADRFRTRDDSDLIAYVLEFYDGWELFVVDRLVV